MRTSEFVKRWNDKFDSTAIKYGDTGIDIMIGQQRMLRINGSSFLITASPMSITSGQFTLINSYLQTKPENRKDERKWVIPWGNRVDGSETISAWRRATGPYISTMSDHRWRSDKSYWFTDSEIEMLKDVQSPAIAQAIDMAKELVSDE